MQNIQWEEPFESSASIPVGETEYRELHFIWDKLKVTKHFRRINGEFFLCIYVSGLNTGHLKNYYVFCNKAIKKLVYKKVIEEIFKKIWHISQFPLDA